MNTTQKSPTNGVEFESVARNNLDIAGHATPIQWHFSRQKSIGFGLDGRNGNARRMAISMFLTSSPPIALRKAVSGYQSHIGAMTMQTTTSGNAQIAPVIQGKSTTDLTRYQAVHQGIAACQWLLIHSKPQQALGKLRSACRHLTQIVSATQAGGADHE